MDPGTWLSARFADRWPIAAALYEHFSSPVLAHVFLIGLGFIGLIAGLLGLIVVLRLRALAAERRRARLIAQWRPLIMASMLEPPDTLPRLARRDWLVFVALWNHLHESVRGEAKEALNALARRVDLAPMSHEVLRRGAPRRQILAALTLGNMRAREAWQLLSRLVRSPNAALSLAAMRGLLQIDPEAALPLLMPEVRARHDWSPARVAALLQEAGTDRVGPWLAEAARAASPEEAARLLRYMEALGCPDGPLIRGFLAESTDERLLATSLQLLRDPRELPWVRRLAAHPHWFVRVQAASALGRFGQAEDQAALVALLADEQWWVRYRAAEALSRLPSAGPGALAALRASREEPQVREILAHVLAERGVEA